ncbi:MAG: cytidine deaminase, partial [Clostridia bacterium]|nr:cytidine deaminase [Clostridia bacterium]
MTYEELIKLAEKAKDGSYSPYSHFRVGAALLTADGSVYTGANVECSSYGGTICAERAALVKAVNDGKRDFSAIAIISDDSEPCYPCGICRQMLSDFSPDMAVISASADG